MPTLADIGCVFDPIGEYSRKLAEQLGLSENETELLIKKGQIGWLGRKDERDKAISSLCSEYGVSRERFDEIEKAVRSLKTR